MKFTLQYSGKTNPASSQPALVTWGQDLTSRYSKELHWFKSILIPDTVIFGQLLIFKTFKLNSISPVLKSSKAASVTSSQHPISSASKFLHCVRMQLNEESEMFKHQSIRKFLRLFLHAAANDFIDSSDTSRQPPIIRVSRFLQNLDKENIESSPTL